MSGHEDAAWDAYFDNSEVARSCCCPSCNHYLPADQYKPDSECEDVTLIKAIVAAARADERERITALADSWQAELDSGAICSEDARYCWRLAVRELRAVATEGEASA